MEPQVDICFKKDKQRMCCMDIVIYIISVLASFIIGLVIGNLTGLVDFLGIGAIVLFLATLLVILLVRIIMMMCCKNKCC